MARYLAGLAYDGSQYCGWQVQTDEPSIQESIESSLSTILKQPVKVKGASRTDSGVHALDQYACFDLPQAVDEGKVYRSLCGLLPYDIRVKSLTQVDDDFDVVNDSHGKVYVYRVWNDRSPHPFLGKFSWWLRTATIDAEKLNQISSLFIGHKNFKAFAAADGSSQTFEREIFEIDIRQFGSFYEIWVSGKGFLKQMVRNIVGTMVDGATGKITYDRIESSFEERDRREMGICAPACGLILTKIFFDKRQKIRDLQNEAQKGVIFPL